VGNYPGVCFSSKEVDQMSELSELDRAEIERSAKEARGITVEAPKRDQVERYLNPPSDRLPTGICLLVAGRCSG
jgi:hypothetical protein